MQPDNDRDFQYRYSGTYVSAYHEGILHPVYLTEVESRDEFEVVLDRERTKFYPEYDDLLFDYPELGCRQIGRRAINVERHINRIYKRGLVAQECVYNYYGHDLWRPTNWDILYAVYNPSFVDFTRCLELLEGNYESVAISKEFVIANNDFIEEPIIYYGNDKVGIVKEGKAVLPYSLDFIAEELELLDVNTEMVNARN